jgi:hypothetical protein
MFYRLLKITNVRWKIRLVNESRNFVWITERNTCQRISRHFLEAEGISHQLTVEYTPQQNGVAERANRTLVEMARCILLQANLPDTLWAEAVNTATYLRNRCATVS